MKDLPHPDERVTFAEVAEMLGVDRSTVWRWAESGMLQWWRIGLRKSFTTRAALAKFQADHITTAAATSPKTESAASWA